MGHTRNNVQVSIVETCSQIPWLQESYTKVSVFAGVQSGCVCCYMMYIVVQDSAIDEVVCPTV